MGSKNQGSDTDEMQLCEANTRCNSVEPERGSERIKIGVMLRMETYSISHQ